MKNIKLCLRMNQFDPLPYNQIRLMLKNQNQVDYFRKELIFHLIAHIYYAHSKKARLKNKL